MLQPLHRPDPGRNDPVGDPWGAGHGLSPGGFAAGRMGSALGGDRNQVARGLSLVGHTGVIRVMLMASADRGGCGGAFPPVDPLADAASESARPSPNACPRLVGFRAQRGMLWGRRTTTLCALGLMTTAHVRTLAPGENWVPGGGGVGLLSTPEARLLVRKEEERSGSRQTVGRAVWRRRVRRQVTGSTRGLTDGCCTRPRGFRERRPAIAAWAPTPARSHGAMGVARTRREAAAAETASDWPATCMTGVAFLAARALQLQCEQRRLPPTEARISTPAGHTAEQGSSQLSSMRLPGPREGQAGLGMTRSLAHACRATGPIESRSARPDLRWRTGSANVGDRAGIGGQTGCPHGGGESGSGLAHARGNAAVRIDEMGAALAFEGEWTRAIG